MQPLMFIYDFISPLHSGCFLLPEKLLQCYHNFTATISKNGGNIQLVKITCALKNYLEKSKIEGQK